MVSPVRLGLAASRLALAFLIGLPAARAASIQNFSPVGDVTVVREARAAFNEPVARLGDPRQAAPLTVDCPVAGSGRWADSRHWVYRFDAPVPAGVRCVFTASPSFLDLRGAPLAGRHRFEFQTGGPAIVSSLPSQGAAIDEDQIFVLRLNGSVALESLADRVFCEAEGIGERIPARPVDPKDAETLFRRFDVDPARAVAVKCQQRLPPGVAMALAWDAGITTPGGVATRLAQRLKFDVRNPFTASFACTRENADSPCTPLGEMRLEFSERISREDALKFRLTVDGAVRSPVLDDDVIETTVSRIRFKPPFPESASFVIDAIPGLKDDSGRALSNADFFPMKGRTGPRGPLAKFAASPFGILELEPAPDQPALLPLTLRGIESPPAINAIAPGRAVLADLQPQSDADIIEWYARVAGLDQSWLGEDDLARLLGRAPRQRPRGEAESQLDTRAVSLLAGETRASRITLPAREAAGTDVIGVPLATPGFHVLEIESPRLGESLLGEHKPMFVRTSALVTNMAVHLKVGRENALVWVTSLDAGKPVAQAAIAVSDCRGKPLWQGTTDADGIARIEGRALIPSGGSLHALTESCPEERPGLFVSARRTDERGRADLSFAWSQWTKGIESWRFEVPVGDGDEASVRAHTVFDRTLVRAGETVSMKHLVRRLRGGGFERPDDRALPPRVAIVHTGSDQTWSYPLEWKRGAAETRFVLPPSARLGEYEVHLDYGEAKSQPGVTPATAPLWFGRLSAGSFRVEAFRLPVFEARVNVAARDAVQPDQVPLDLQVGYLSGGPAANLPVKVSAMLTATPPSFAGFEDFAFDREDWREEPLPAGVFQGRLVADKVAATLGANGTARVPVASMPKIAVPHRIDAEMTFDDPNGETQSVSQSGRLWPSSLAVGIRTAGWAAVGKKVTVRVAALDLGGKPRPQTAVSVRAQLQKTVSTRKRLVGGFYAYENSRQVKGLGDVCRGSTDSHGLLECEFASNEAGNVLLIAESADAEGRVSTASTSVWLTGHGELWFEADNDDRIDLLPERRRYAPGENARFQVRMPFRYATALVAIEREGVIESRVVQLSGREPVIDVPITAAHAPNVYVSVLALRGRLREVPWYSLFTWGWRSPRDWFQEWREYGRIARPAPTVDLARPAAKLGLAQVLVGTEGARLGVTVNTDAPRYQVRGVAKVAIQVRQPDGTPAPAGTEVAIAAVDQALLELAPNRSWNLLDAMMSPRPYGVQTATGQMHVVGRRHFGRKAVAPGGGGGRAPTRELFDTLLYWNPRVVLDAEGRANVDVRLNDSLSAFRIAAIADDGEGRFGSGETTIRVLQDLQLISAMPPVVRDGDSFAAGFTVRNSTDRLMKVAVEAKAVHTPGNETIGPFSASVELAAGAAQRVEFPVFVPAGSGELSWEITGQDATSGVVDRLATRQRVVAAVPATVRQAMLAQVDDTLTVPLETPAGALPGRSSLSIALSPTIAGSIAGVRDWFAAYPYTCLEQRASRALGLDDERAWQALMQELPGYIDNDGLAAYFPLREGEAPRGSDALTAYLLGVSRASGLSIPEESRRRLEQGLVAFIEGRIRREGWTPRADAVPRRLAAIEALSRAGLAQPPMLASMQIDVSTLPTGALVDWWSILNRMPALPDRDARLAEADSMLRARLGDSGARLTLSDESEAAWWWLMVSGDSIAARLVLGALERPEWRDEMPKLVNGLLARQRRGAWSTTVANVWGKLATARFSQVFESTPVAGRTRALIGGNGASGEQAWPRPDAPAAERAGPREIRLDWPDGRSQLQVSHEGDGRPWAEVRALAAVPLVEPVAAGYTVKRVVTPVEQKSKDTFSRGDIVRVRIEIEAAQPMTWVVVDDPVPAGATILGSGLGRDTRVGTERREGAGWLAFVERRFEGVRGYYEYLPAGRAVYEYTVRLNQSGEFRLPPTRVEAMYAPEVHGELPNPPIKVQP